MRLGKGSLFFLKVLFSFHSAKFTVVQSSKINISKIVSFAIGKKWCIIYKEYGNFRRIVGIHLVWPWNISLHVRIFGIWSTSLGEECKSEENFINQTLIFRGGNGAIKVRQGLGKSVSLCGRNMYTLVTGICFLCKWSRISCGVSFFISVAKIVPRAFSFSSGVEIKRLLSRRTQWRKHGTL